MKNYLRLKKVSNMIIINKFHESSFNTDLMYGTFVISFFDKFSFSMSVVKTMTYINVQFIPKNVTYAIRIYYSLKEYRENKKNE